MRSSILSLLTSALLTTALPSPQTEISENTTSDEPLPHDFKVAKDLIAGQPETPGARTMDQVYGPYRVKPLERDYPTINSAMPCTNCHILAIQATLEYTDGSEANINTGVSHRIIHGRYLLTAFVGVDVQT